MVGMTERKWVRPTDSERAALIEMKIAAKSWIGRELARLGPKAIQAYESRKSRA